jgi:murein DD-endopeptidase MepM/ murein hydrolase activator NlpD
LSARLLHKVHVALERALPEQRLFLKSDYATRFVRLRPGTQVMALGATALLIAWTIVASAILFIESIGSGSARDEARRDQAIYEARLDSLAQDRDARIAEVVAERDRFATALKQVSAMQSALLASEERRKELETGIGVIQKTLRKAMTERDEARADLAAVMGEADGSAKVAQGMAPADLTATVDFLSGALARVAVDRDQSRAAADDARAETDKLAYDMRLMEERHDEIFSQLEEAVTISMAPLDKMFTQAGLDPDELIAQVRKGYSGTGGPVMPMLPPLPDGDKGAANDPARDRAQAILEGFDRMNMYRIAAEKSPFVLPLKTAFRFTSGFGRRWGRLHAGVDLAGTYGSPIYATADGVVTHAGPESGYGNLIEIQHAFGLSTRFGHLSKVRVTVGQRVSRGDRIGDMGNTGHSTGTHLHYEVRVGGNPVNPMTFIKAGTDVF